MAAPIKTLKQTANQADEVLEAAVDYFAARSHEAWRRQLLKTNPEQKGRPRMRLRGGLMVDVNQPWAKLHANARTDNMRAARDAYDAVMKFPSDREAAADYVHRCWIRRNRGDKSQPQELFKPYKALSEVEKDKDRAHIDTMAKALAAVRRRLERTAPRVAAGKATPRPHAKTPKAKAGKAKTTIAETTTAKTTKAKTTKSKIGPKSRAATKAKLTRPAKPAAAKASTNVSIDAKTWRRLQAAADEISALVGAPVAPEALVNAGLGALATVLAELAADARAKT